MRYFLKLFHKWFGYGSVENVNRTKFKRNCLLVYIVNPFVSGQIDLAHQNQWQATEMARIIGEYYFNVDVINFNEKVKLNKKYDMVIDIHPGLNKSYKNNMNDECMRVAYATGSNPSFSNKAEKQRIDDLYLRKGVRLQPRRQAQPFLREDLESLDAMMFIGNSYNLRTYDEFNLKKVCHIVNTGHLFLAKLDLSRKSARNFLFLASGGQVHKGLDLLLDFFVLNKDLKLFICSDFKREPDFCKLYHHELFGFDNIKAIGFVDIKSTQFRDICDQCAYIVMPSCSEANAGSVLTGMSAGLIPIVSRECGFEEDEVQYFENCSPETIAGKLLMASSQTPQWISDGANKSMEIVKTRYSHEHYSASIRSSFKQILD